MMYTKYFGVSIKQNGVPNIDAYQLGRMMNIVVLEVTIKEREKFKDRYSFNSIFKLKNKLTDLSGNLRPKDLLEEMILLSRNS